MSTALQIRYVRIRTANGWQEAYDLDKPVVAILGPVDTGKSSLADCIAFALGREGIEFRGAVDSHLREVEIGLKIGFGSYILTRSRRTSSYIEVFDLDRQLVGQYPIRSQPEMPTISSWLLEQLALDDLFSAVRLAGGHTLDFPDSLLSYCYLLQDDIDRHIIRPRREDSVRLGVFKLLFNLTTPQYEKLQTDIREADTLIDRLRRQAQTVQKFFSDADATSIDTVQSEIADLRAREIHAATRVESLRSDARAVSKFEAYELQRIKDARKAVADCEGTLDRLKTLHNKAIAELSASDKALVALSDLEDRSPDDRPTLNLAFTSQCPVCESSLVDRTPSPGHCFVCGEPLPGAKHHHERKLLESRPGASNRDGARATRYRLSGAQDSRSRPTGIGIPPAAG